MKNILLGLMLTFGLTANASSTTDRQIDFLQNSTGGSQLAVPATGSNLVSDSASQTLTNKTISGSSNTLSNIPTSAISSGQLGVANGGTGASTLTSGSVVVGNGTSAVSLVAPGTSGNVLTSNGSTWVSQAASAGGGSANVVATVASPQSISAATAVAVTGQITNGLNVVFISGNGGAVTVTAAPSVTACTAAGELLTLIGGANNVTLQDIASLAGSKLHLNGNLTLGTTSPASYSASFVCDGTNWIETARY